MKMLRFPDMLTRTGLKRTAIYKLIKAKKLPAPVKMGGASGWPEHEVDAAVAALAAKRTTGSTTVAPT